MDATFPYCSYSKYPTRSTFEIRGRIQSAAIDDAFCRASCCPEALEAACRCLHDLRSSTCEACRLLTDTLARLADKRATPSFIHHKNPLRSIQSPRNVPKLWSVRSNRKRTELGIRHVKRSQGPVRASHPRFNADAAGCRNGTVQASARSVRSFTCQLTVSTKTRSGVGGLLLVVHGLYRDCGGIPAAEFRFCVFVGTSSAHRERHFPPRTMCGDENDGQNSAVSSPRSDKGSLAFILDGDASTGKRRANAAQLEAIEPTDVKLKRPSIGRTISSLLTPTSSASDENEAHSTITPTASVARKGSKYCVVEGCVSRAKHARRCWKHGGSVKCKTPGCRNRAKTKGVCWSHGGGTICSNDQCTTIAVSNGVCWAHGGGKRCVTPGCSRPAYERTRNMCSMHYNAGSIASLAAAKRPV